MTTLHQRRTGQLTFTLAAASGAIVANLYYAQTLVPLIAGRIGLPRALAGLIVMLTQMGYGTGLLLIAPLGDLIENRRLIVGLFGAASLSLLGLTLARDSVTFLLCCFLLGLSSVAAQVIVPLAAHMTPVETRGKVVGNVMSGLLLGIMLARPLASWLADLFAWQAVFVLSIGLMLIFGAVLLRALPVRRPEQASTYRALLGSLPRILEQNPVLRRRAGYQAVLFGVFSMFWTSIAMLLSGPTYGYTQREIALFAFAGAAGALTAPVAGRMADRGFTRPATGCAIAAVASSFVLARWGERHNIGVLVATALLLDAGVSCNLVSGQRAIYTLAAEERGRLNGLYMAIFFVGGALGSGVAGYAYSRGGWSMITNIGAACALLVFVYFMTEFRQAKRSLDDASRP